ncbi:MAG TPA: LOG family protein, partial [Caulobacteraceae bacterium]
MKLCVYCGTAFGADPAYLAAAVATGRLCAEQGVEIVYGGAKVGLMGAVADAALAAGGRVTGVIPRALVEREIAHDGLTASHVVGSMHERKA